MISASHNPPEYNGIKIFDHNGQKISKFLNIKLKIYRKSSQNISVLQKRSLSKQIKSLWIFT